MAPRIVTELTAAFDGATSGYEANLAAILRSGQVHPAQTSGAGGQRGQRLAPAAGTAPSPTRSAQRPGRRPPSGPRSSSMPERWGSRSP